MPSPSAAPFEGAAARGSGRRWLSGLLTLLNWCLPEVGHPGRLQSLAATLFPHGEHVSGEILQVLVRDNNVDQALRVLKKKLQREGVFREMKQRRAYEKPSEKRAREKSEAIRRSRKAARKVAQREGLLPGPKKKRPLPPRRPAA